MRSQAGVELIVCDTMAAGGGQALHMENIFQLLESSETVKDIKEIILDNLQTNNESWLIQLLVDRYFQTQSTNIQVTFTVVFFVILLKNLRD